MARVRHLALVLDHHRDAAVRHLGRVRLRLRLSVSQPNPNERDAAAGRRVEPIPAPTPTPTPTPTPNPNPNPDQVPSGGDALCGACEVASAIILLTIAYPYP